MAQFRAVTDTTQCRILHSKFWQPCSVATDLCVLLPVSECWWVWCVEKRLLNKRRVYFQVHVTVIIIVIIIIFTAVTFTILPSTCEPIRHWRCETSWLSKQYPTIHTLIAPIQPIYSPSKCHKLQDNDTMSHTICIFTSALLKGSTVGKTSQSRSNKWHTDTAATFRRLTDCPRLCALVSVRTVRQCSSHYTSY